MVKKLALILAVLMILLLAWSLLGPSAKVSITINGREITSPLGALTGLWQIILTTVILFCVAILLVFVFAGAGLVIMGCLALVGVILAAVLLPFLLPLLIPLYIDWLFCALLRQRKTTKHAS